MANTWAGWSALEPSSGALASLTGYARNVPSAKPLIEHTASSAPWSHFVNIWQQLTGCLALCVDRICQSHFQKAYPRFLVRLVVSRVSGKCSIHRIRAGLGSPGLSAVAGGYLPSASR